MGTLFGKLRQAVLFGRNNVRLPTKKWRLSITWELYLQILNMHQNIIHGFTHVQTGKIQH